jgi:hypothetical protein
MWDKQPINSLFVTQERKKFSWLEIAICFSKENSNKFIGVRDREQRTLTNFTIPSFIAFQIEAKFKLNEAIKSKVIRFLEKLSKVCQVFNIAHRS